jgi:hypothetical protein
MRQGTGEMFEQHPMRKARQSDMDQQDFHWEHLQHEEKLFANRSGFFLVAEAVLLAGAMSFLTPLQTTISQAEQPARVPLGPFCIAAMALALIWLYANIEHLLTSHRHVKAQLRAGHPAWSVIEGAHHRWPSVNWLVGLGLPVLLLIVWWYVWLAYAGQTDLAPVVRGTSRVLVTIGLVLNVAGVVAIAFVGLPRIPGKAFRSAAAEDVTQPTTSLVSSWSSNWSSFLGLGLLTTGFVVQLIGIILGW